MSDLLLPLSSLPGFDPVGLRVRHPAGGVPWGVCVAVDDSRPNVHNVVVATTELGPPHDRDLDFAPARLVDLNLADASTADRVARWIACQVGVEVGCTAPKWIYIEPSPGFFEPGGWELHGVGDEFYYIRPGHAAVCGMDQDGSRHADRLALRNFAEYLGANGAT